MTHYLRLMPALALVVALAACNDSDGSAENDEGGETAGDSLNPTAVASEIVPPLSSQLPSELLPPS